MSVPPALAVLGSFNTLFNKFASDDTHQVLNNTFIKELKNIPLAFTTTVWSYVTEDIAMTAQPYFRPFFSVLFTINYSIFGQAAWGWHVANVLIHAAVTFLVYAVIAELTERKRLAAMTAALFAVHPVHAESVAWISGVTDPLLGLFLLPSLFFYLRYQKTERKYFLGLCAVFYFFALLSKETAIGLPVVLIYHSLAHGRRRIFNTAVLGSLMAVMTLLFAAMRYFALGGALLGGGGARYPLLPALATIPVAVVKYLTLLIWPFGYAYQHPTPFVEDPGSLRFIGPLILLAVIAAAVVAARSRTLTFSAVWFVALLAPALAALRQLDFEYVVQERYLYLASMGVCLAVAHGLDYLAERKSLVGAPHLAYGVLLAVLIVWILAYVRVNRTWYDSVTVYQNCISVNPGLPLARVALAGFHFNEGRLKEAESLARSALELDPTHLGAHMNLSFFAHSAGKLDEAIGHLERAVEVARDTPFTKPDRATVYLNLGLLYSQRKEFDKAERAIQRSIEIWPRPTGWYYLGQVYFGQGRYEEAREMYEKTLERVPKRYAPIHLSLARVYELLGLNSEARMAYEKYLELAPANAKDREDAERRLSRLRTAV
jgi:tetratricopeptide (TPR) repeat protein